MRKPRLARLERLFVDRPVYFITACVHERKHLLNNDPMHDAFQNFTQLAASRGIFVGNYVLMPDHLHLFAAFSPDAMKVSLWVKSMKNFLSKTLREEGVPAPHWQKGFFDHVLRSEESYAEKWNYVARNPVRAGLVEHPEKWPFRGEIHALSILRRRSATAEDGAHRAPQHQVEGGQSCSAASRPVARRVGMLEVDQLAGHGTTGKMFLGLSKALTSPLTAIRADGEPRRQFCR